MIALIQRFELTVRQRPDDIFFRYVDERGEAHSYTYEETRFLAAGLALKLQRRGVKRGGVLAVDMGNCAAFVLVALAAAYGGFLLVILNHRLLDLEKEERLRDLRLSGVFCSVKLDERTVHRLISDMPSGYDDAFHAEATMATASRANFDSRPNVRNRRDRRVSSRLNRGVQQHARGLGSREIVNYIDRSRASFDRSDNAIIMFTSGTTGKSKAVRLTWENLLSSAEAFNSTFSRRGEGLWQLALPMFHIGGFQVLVRSVLNESSILLYNSFDAKRVLADAHRYEATHISVVDKMLQDMIATKSSILSSYQCILLGGGALNATTLRRACEAQAHVYASYGMTETSSLIAATEVTRSFRGELALLPGYSARIVNPDSEGIGQLAVRGPGIFAGYINSQVPRTVDGFFLTGDFALLSRGRIVMFERTEDMFVSGGENIYSAEICRKILDVPGVSDVFVFGAKDDTWGRRPIAFIERDGQGQKAASSDEFLYPELVEEHRRLQLAKKVSSSLEVNLSKIYRPDRAFVLDQFPRTAVGKVDRSELMQRYEDRIELKRLTLYQINQPFLTPQITAKTVLRTRVSLIVEVEDWKGRTGLGECVSFIQPWYLPETLQQDIQVLEQHLIPLVLSESSLSPCEASDRISLCEQATAFPMARSAIEMALWDLYGEIVGKPLWQLIASEDMSAPAPQASSGVWPLSSPQASSGVRPLSSSQASQVLQTSQNVALLSGTFGAQPRASTQAPPAALVQRRVSAGAVLGIKPLDQTLLAVNRLVALGYQRVKLKVAPGNDYRRIIAVREAFPRLTIMLDANQCYTEQDLPILQALDRFDIACIEEPLKPRSPHSSASGNSVEHFKRLAQLQQQLKTPICLDESLVTSDDLSNALSHPELSCYAIKIGKLGGIRPALNLYRKLKRRNALMWMGGMYDTSISKRAHAAFEVLEGISLPGDLGGVMEYFGSDITTPPMRAEGGSVVLNPSGYGTGLGCKLDQEALQRVLVSRRDFRA